MQPAKKITLVLLVALIVAAVSAQAQTDPKTTAAKDADLVNIELKDMPVKQAIDKLFEGTGRSYFVLPGVTGRVVDLKLKGITFDEALKALTDAADLAYSIEDGVYTVGTPEKVAMASSGQITGAGPSAKPAPESKAPAKAPSKAEQPKATRAQPAPAAPASQPIASPTTVVINETQPPVYYGHMPPRPYGYGYPPVYRFGSVNVVGGGYYPPVVVGGSNTYVMGYGPIYPPPSGWVSPETQRFLRGQWAIQQRPYFLTPYPY